jgi:ABC-type multidrug transport system fused ATPase/permease subunit
MQIKVTKLNHYEENYANRVDEARQKELGKLRSELFVWALSLVVTVISPTLASAATFIVYALVNENHILTAAETFAVLLLFNALRFPINYFGRLLGRLAQALNSMDRIAEYLDRVSREDDEQSTTADAQDENPFSRSKQSSPLLEVRNASFRIGPSRSNDELVSSDAHELAKGFNQTSGFEVSGIEFALHRGEMVGLVGT